MTNSFALITGGSSGIGFEIAKDLASRGYNIVLVSRNEQNLQDCCKQLSEEFVNNPNNRNIFDGSLQWEGWLRKLDRMNSCYRS